MSKDIGPLIAAVSLLLVVGCGEDAVGAGDARPADGGSTTDARPSDGGGTTDAPAGSDGSTGDGADSELSCYRDAAFPAQLPFDRSCGGAGDCFIANHMIDCCGTIRAIGMNKAEQTRFTAAEQQCAETFPLCGCAAFETITDQGSVGGTVAIGVTCDQGSCSTFAP